VQQAAVGIDEESAPQEKGSTAILSTLAAAMYIATLFSHS